MSPDPDTTRLVRAWLEPGRTTLPKHVLDGVLSQLSATPQGQRSRISRWWTAIGNPMRATAGIASTVLIVVVAAGLLSTKGGGVGPLASGSPGPSTTPRERSVAGLPPVGATLSQPSSGELVLHFDGNITNVSRPFSLWLYADGRMVSSRFREIPVGLDPYVGLSEQRLTPAGVQHMRDLALATGLFATDQQYGQAFGYVSIAVRNGDRLVRVTWAGPGAEGESNGPTPSQAQQIQLTHLSALLSASSTWPASVWADQRTTAYLPSTYAICLRRFPSSPDQAGARALLPVAAQGLIALGEPLDDGWCSLLATADARVLANALVDAGIQAERPGPSELWLRYILQEPGVNGGHLWVSFEMVLPNGDRAWLGGG